MAPGTEWTIADTSGAVRGIEGVSHYRINDDGIRGRAFGNEASEYRILAVGGSTTQCATLDESEAWPHLLETLLAARGPSEAWVGNVGVSGLTTRHHVLHLKYLLRQYPGIDAVVALVGANDLVRALAQGRDYAAPAPIGQPAAEREAMRRAFAQVPGGLREATAEYPPDAAWYRLTATWQLARRARQQWTARRAFGSPGVALAGPREARARSVKVDSLPPLSEPLREFRRNLHAMADHSAAAGVRLVLVTHPALWRADLPESEEGLLWFGWIGTDWTAASTYYSSGALASGMAAYNRELLEVCRVRSIECVDAARILNPETGLLYDDVHFTELGSRRLAEVLADHFDESPPFRR